MRWLQLHDNFMHSFRKRVHLKLSFRWWKCSKNNLLPTWEGIKVAVHYHKCIDSVDDKSFATKNADDRDYGGGQLLWGELKVRRENSDWFCDELFLNSIEIHSVSWRHSLNLPRNNWTTTYHQAVLPLNLIPFPFTLRTFQVRSLLSTYSR
jgi:hypothetical protein